MWCIIIIIVFLLLFTRQHKIIWSEFHWGAIWGTNTYRPHWQTTLIDHTDRPHWVTWDGERKCTPDLACCHRRTQGYWGGTATPSPPAHWSGFLTLEGRSYTPPGSSLFAPNKQDTHKIQVWNMTWCGIILLASGTVWTVHWKQYSMPYFSVCLTSNVLYKMHCNTEQGTV